jgi:hypothetical protein
MTAVFAPVGPTALELQLAKLRQCQPSQALGPCGCIGPQNGQPACPCQMRNVVILNGRYVRTTDLGPAPINEQLGHCLKARP